MKIWHGQGKSIIEIKPVVCKKKKKEGGPGHTQYGGLIYGNKYIIHECYLTMIDVRKSFVHYNYQEMGQESTQRPLDNENNSKWIYLGSTKNMSNALKTLPTSW